MGINLDNLVVWTLVTWRLVEVQEPIEIGKIEMLHAAELNALERINIIFALVMLQRWV